MTIRKNFIISALRVLTLLGVTVSLSAFSAPTDKPYDMGVTMTGTTSVAWPFSTNPEASPVFWMSYRVVITNLGPSTGVADAYFSGANGHITSIISSSGCAATGVASCRVSLKPGAQATVNASTVLYATQGWIFPTSVYGSVNLVDVPSDRYTDTNVTNNSAGLTLPFQR